NGTPAIPDLLFAPGGPSRSMLATAGRSREPSVPESAPITATVVGTSGPFQRRRGKGESTASPPEPCRSSGVARGGLFLSAASLLQRKTSSDVFSIVGTAVLCCSRTDNHGSAPGSAVEDVCRSDVSWRTGRDRALEVASAVMVQGIGVRSVSIIVAGAGARA